MHNSTGHRNLLSHTDFAMTAILGTGRQRSLKLALKRHSLTQRIEFFVQVVVKGPLPMPHFSLGIQINEADHHGLLVDVLGGHTGHHPRWAYPRT